MCSALYSFPPYSMGHWSTPCTASILAEPLGMPMGPSVSRASHRVLLSLLVASCSSRTPVRQLLFPRTPIPKDVTAGWTACELGGHNSLCSRDGRGREAGVSLRLDESPGLVGKWVPMCPQVPRQDTNEDVSSDTRYCGSRALVRWLCIFILSPVP